MALRVTAHLTPRGLDKLQAVADAVYRSAQQAAVAVSEAMKDVAAAHAPDEDQEASILSRGVTRGGRTLGTPEGGRFLRVGGNIPVRQAIRQSRSIPREMTGGIFVTAARVDALNRDTGFSWQTRRRGIMGPTEPANGAYVQALEGGGIYTVEPNEGTLGLEPEPGVFTQQMTKTIPPFHMFASAIQAGRAEGPRIAGAIIRKAVRAVGR